MAKEIVNRLEKLGYRIIKEDAARLNKFLKERVVLQADTGKTYLFTGNCIVEVLNNCGFKIVPME